MKLINWDMFSVVDFTSLVLHLIHVVNITDK